MTMTFGDDDPFAAMLAPPPNETVSERAARLAREAEAKRVNDEIEAQLKLDRMTFKKQKDTVRILLLGQSESGKSTTLKNFRMQYAKESWNAERDSWKAVIQLNLVRSIITIVETIQSEMNGEPLSAPPLGSTHSGQSQNSLHIGGDSHDSSTSDSAHYPLLDGGHQLLAMRLGPLRRVEADLKRRLGSEAENEVDNSAVGLSELDVDYVSPRAFRREFGVRRLKDALEHSMIVVPKSRSSHSADGEEIDEITDILYRCREDMKALWTDSVVRIVLKRRKVRLEQLAGFFLNDIDRIASDKYQPTDDDVIRARLQTVGIQEYRIQFESQPQAFGREYFGREWLLYDVGGSRTMRHAWVPFFEGINAVIFLAPISCFDERLSEDTRVNRLEDSFLLWKNICSSKLLAKTSMILFLNKCDLLKRKLRAGILVKNYLPSFGDRANDINTVVKYLREKFKEILRQYSPEPRPHYFYATSVIDTKATADTIKAVKDSVVREYLKTADFM